MNKLAKVLVVLLCLAAYLNIGWYYGVYVENYSWHSPNSSGIASFFAGPDNLMASRNSEKCPNPRVVYGIASALWPFMLAVFIISWVIWGAYTIIVSIFTGIVRLFEFLGWFIFSGGAGELLVEHPAWMLCSLGVIIFILGFFVNSRKYQDVMLKISSVLLGFGILLAFLL